MKHSPSLIAIRSVGMVLVILQLFSACTPEQKREPEFAPPPPAFAHPDSVPVATNSALKLEGAGLKIKLQFREVSKEVNILFNHHNGMAGQYFMPELIGSGLAVLDFDRDGDLDIFCVQGGDFGPEFYAGNHRLPGKQIESHRDIVFRNDLIETSKLHFTDWTEQSGIRGHDYGMGVAVADVNQDGWPDIYVTQFGPNQWWINRGDGTFGDGNQLADVVDPGLLSVSAAFFDYDLDGLMDLLVGEYVNFSFARHKDCKNNRGDVDYCGPNSYQPEFDRLLKNVGQGRFVDVSQKTAIATTPGAALGVVAADFNGDLKTDVYVANDGMANFLWINNGDGTFTEEARMAGCAFNMLGGFEASMGVDAADFDQDGDIDLFMTHLIKEKNTLYINNGQGLFVDRTPLFGLDAPSRGFTSFGAGWGDLDSDGDVDLYVANGSVSAVEALVLNGHPYPYAMPNQLFQNNDGVYQEIDGGEAFTLSEVSRGSVDADIDNDGDLDILISNNNGPLRLLLNETESPYPWIGFQIVRKETGMDYMGVRVALTSQGKPILWRRVRRDGSYASSRDPRVLFGLGKFEIDGMQLYIPGSSEPVQRSITPDMYRAYHRIEL